MVVSDQCSGLVVLYLRHQTRRRAARTASNIVRQSGSIRALAQSGKTRTSTLADVPAIAESYPGFEAYAWWGVFAPAGTPKAIVSRFADELAASLREPGVAKQLNETQQVTFALGGPEELRKFVSEQMRMWGPVAREHNIQAD